ncbi:MAG: PaaI family thioesterase [Pararhodobacter sp.]|nr:PaaI family thioesterase [Pararhodobacter sp.]
MNSPAPDPRIEASFAQQSMMRSLQARLIEAGGGRCVIRAPILPAFCQQQGFGHGGITFALGDTAAGYAALSLLPAEREVLTAELKINYLAPATGDEFEAIGEVVRAGRRLMVVRAEVFALAGESRRSIALLLGTWCPVEPA